MFKQLFILCGICPAILTLHAQEELNRKADEVNQVIWSRFIGKDNIMYDYTGLKGEVVLPTPEECAADLPNALGWWTPIENGGFFNGMYLVAQCDRYERNKTPENREKVRRLVAGLYKLQDVGSTPGFIARGVGSDGKCHYAASSNDQNFPWFLGLGRYLDTDIPTPEERQECIARLVRQGEALKKLNWKIPGDRPNFERGWWLGSEYTACVHIATATRVLYETTGDAKWKKLHYELMRGRLPDGKERKVCIASGPINMAGWSAWFLSNCQYAVRILFLRETDPELKKYYAASLRNTARRAVSLIPYYKRFRPSPEQTGFTPDWHVMMPPFAPQKNGTEAAALALEQNKVWSKKSPAVAQEKVWLKPALCAAWIVVLSEETELKRNAMPEIRRMILGLDGTRLYYATFFYLENLVETLNKSDLQKI